jgi:hypothetical protein
MRINRGGGGHFHNCKPCGVVTRYARYHSAQKPAPSCLPLWRGEHAAIRQLVEDFARYLYLPRLKEPAVLLEAIRDGLRLITWSQDSFAYAESFDDAVGRYRGLRCGEL